MFDDYNMLDFENINMMKELANNLFAKYSEDQQNYFSKGKNNISI